MLPKSKSIIQSPTSPSFSHADTTTTPIKAVGSVPKIVFIAPPLENAKKNTDMTNDTFSTDNDRSRNQVKRFRDRKRRR